MSESKNAAAPAKMSRFGHDENPAEDFCMEVRSLATRMVRMKIAGISQEERARSLGAIVEDMAKAMEFTVGGTQSAVDAKSHLRLMFDKARAEYQRLLPEFGSEIPDPLRDAARVLHNALAHPDSRPGTAQIWHAAFDAMRDDHAQNMDISGQPDWPTTLLAALGAIAGDKARDHD